MRRVALVSLLILMIVININSEVRAASGVCLRIDFSQIDDYPISKVEQQFFTIESGQLNKTLPNQLPYKAPFFNPYHPGIVDLPSPNSRYNAVLSGQAGTKRFDKLSIQDQQKHLRYDLVEDAYDLVAHWSPDGQQLAYVWHEDADVAIPGATHVTIVNADGTQKRDVTLWANVAPYNHESITALNWSADQQYVAFQLNDRDSSTIIYVIPTVRPKSPIFSMSLTIDYPEANDPDFNSFTDFSLLAWSSHGHHFALADEHDIIFGTPEKGVQVRTPITNPELNVTPLWSPDDQFLAVLHHESLTVLSATGKELQSTHVGDLSGFIDPYRATSLTYGLKWTQNTLIFPQESASSAGNDYDLVALNPTTEALTTIAQHFQSFGWPLSTPYISSPHADLIVLTVQGNTSQLNLIKGNQAIKIADGFESIDDVEWSMDGQYVAFVTVHKNESRSFTGEDLIWMKADGSDKHIVSAQTIPFITWLKSQDSLFYVDREAGQSSAMNSINGYWVDVVKGSQVRLMQRDESTSVTYSLGDSREDDTGDNLSWTFLPSATSQYFIISYAGSSPIYYSGSLLVDQTGKLIKTFDGFVDEHQPIWSPDGTKIVVLANVEQNLMATPAPEEVDVVSTAGEIVWRKIVPDKMRVENTFWVECP